MCLTQKKRLYPILSPCSGKVPSKDSSNSCHVHVTSSCPFWAPRPVQSSIVHLCSCFFFKFLQIRIFSRSFQSHFPFSYSHTSILLDAVSTEGSGSRRRWRWRLDSRYHHSDYLTIETLIPVVRYSGGSLTLGTQRRSV